MANRAGDVHQFILSFMGRKQYPPTFEEIRIGVGLSSKSMVNYYLDQLEEQGKIIRVPNTIRGIQLTGDNHV